MRARVAVVSHCIDSGVTFLFAPGAGAPSSSEWMRTFARHLKRLGAVESFDYPYQLAGRRSPDRQPVLVAAHQAAYERVRARAKTVVLVGKSMGGRIGCHLAVQLADAAPVALVCLGYPLVGRAGTMRDTVLLQLSTPVLLVQGTRDPLCPTAALQAVRRRMTVPNQLYLVENGDHSLIVTKSRLTAAGLAQEDVFERAVDAIQSFIEALPVGDTAS